MVVNIAENPFISIPKEVLKDIRDNLTSKQAGNLLLNLYSYYYEGEEVSAISDSKSKSIWKRLTEFNKRRQADKYLLKLEEYRQSLRNNPTRAENIVRLYFTKNNIKYEFQKIIMGASGKGYIADFYLPDKKIIYEVDGSSHVGKEAEDKKRTKDLEKQGYKVVRSTNEEVYNGIIPEELK